MNEVPDWLWQGLSVWAVGKSLEWAWNHRQILLDKLARQPVRISATGDSIGDGGATLTAGASADLRWKVNALTGADADLRWSVEAPTPSLARRLEELASWYMHVS